MELPSLGKSGEGKAKVRVPCFGCFRFGVPLGHDMSYIDPQEPLKWLYEDGRGNWCSECFPTWRTSWSTSHSLTLFGKHIKTSSSFAEWEWSLLAFVMLKYRGLLASTTAVSQEIACLKYFCSLIGFPSFQYAVVPLEEYIRDPQNQGARAEDLICCTVRTGGENRIGVFVDIGPVDRNTAMDVAPHRVAMRRWLPVTSEGDRRLYQSLSESSGADMKVPSASNAQIVAYMPAQTKLEAKLQLCEKASIVLLQEFSLVGWENDLKEAEFSEPLKKSATSCLRRAVPATWA